MALTLHGTVSDNTDLQIASNNNTPIFAVELSGTQTISDATITKIAYDTEEVDTDDAFDSSTNYRFTVPTGKAGKYKFDVFVRVDSNTSNDLRSALIYLYKNGVNSKVANNNYSTNDPRADTLNLSCILDLSVGDYIEIYANVNSIDNGTISLNGGVYTQFCGHRLIG